MDEADFRCFPANVKLLAVKQVAEQDLEQRQWLVQFLTLVLTAVQSPRKVNNNNLFHPSVVFLALFESFNP